MGFLRNFSRGCKTKSSDRRNLKSFQGGANQGLVTKETSDFTFFTISQFFQRIQLHPFATPPDAHGVRCPIHLSWVVKRKDSIPVMWQSCSVSVLGLVNKQYDLENVD